MALGGGTWLFQNKKLPGTYINFVSKVRASVDIADRGYGTMPLTLDWGPVGEVFTVTAEDFQENSMAYFGYDYTAPELKGLRDLFLNLKTGYFWLLDMELPGLINIKIAGIVTGNQVVFGSILIKLLQQAADFLLGRISATGCAYIVNNHIQVWKPDINELHGMEAGTMSVTVAVTYPCGFAAKLRKVFGFPKSINFTKSCTAWTEQGRVAIMVHQIGHGLIEGGEIPKCFLFALDSFLDYIRPPPVALQPIDRAKTIR